VKHYTLFTDPVDGESDVHPFRFYQLLQLLTGAMLALAVIALTAAIK